MDAAERPSGGWSTAFKQWFDEQIRQAEQAARQDERRKVAPVVEAAKVWEEMRTRTLKLIEAGEVVDFRSPEFDMGESEDALKRAIRALAEEVS